MSAVGIELPNGDPLCRECYGEGWLEPDDLPNDTVLAFLGVEPCFGCAERSGVNSWYEQNRQRLAGMVV